MKNCYHAWNFSIKQKVIYSEKRFKMFSTFREMVLLRMLHSKVLWGIKQKTKKRFFYGISAKKKNIVLYTLLLGQVLMLGQSPVA